MSQHQFLKRMPVDQQQATRTETVTFPAPVRGIIINENESYMQPGGAVVLDNWKPTMKSIALRGGCALWATLPETTPVISGFSYVSGIIHKMFAGNATKLYDVTTTPAVIATGQHPAITRRRRWPTRAATGWSSSTSRRPAAAVQRRDMDVARPRRSDQLGQQHVLHQRPAGAGRGRWQSWKCAINHTSLPSGTFAADRAANSTRWDLDSAADLVSWITGPKDSPVEHGSNLTYVCKYKNRLFFTS